MAITPSIQLHDPEDLHEILDGMTRISVSQLRRGLCPPLYSSGVRYVREPRGREQWQTALQTYRLREGDCEDLSIWRAAEHRLIGVHAMPWVIDVRPGLKHCVVRLPSGQLEDPSKRLGMMGSG